MNRSLNPADVTIGIVGLGLMGSSIATCMLISGHPVVAVEPVSENLTPGKNRVLRDLEDAWSRGMLEEEPYYYMQRLVAVSTYSELKNTDLIIENVKEDLAIKREVFKEIDAVVGSDVIVSSNTSALPISELQRFVSHPERFVGLHWMQPAHTTRFLEIICGAESKREIADYLYALSAKWAKEPVLVKKDIRGFIANRLMYAMYREALFLVNEDYASVEDVDRACRNVAGYFLPMVGVFRWMDFTGISAYHTVMKDLFPTLSNATEPNELISELVKEGGNGVFNGRGFYDYTEEEAKIWQDAYSRFAYEIRDLTLKYPHDLVEKTIGTTGEDKDGSLP